MLQHIDLKIVVPAHSGWYSNDPDPSDTSIHPRSSGATVVAELHSPVEQLEEPAALVAAVADRVGSHLKAGVLLASRTAAVHPVLDSHSRSSPEALRLLVQARGSAGGRVRALQSLYRSGRPTSFRP